MAYHPQGKENGVQMTHLIYHHGRRSDELEHAGLARKTLAKEHSTAGLASFHLRLGVAVQCMVVCRCQQWRRHRRLVV